MLKRQFLSFASICLLCLQACGQPALSEGHQVDPKQDVIIGEMDAPNELILYLSPGDRNSLRLYLKHFQTIKDEYVEKGRLRVVLRETPNIIYQLKDDDGGLTKYDSALIYSIMLGVHLRCAYQYHGAEAYDKTWSLIGTSVALAVVQDGADLWPYFDRDAMQTVFFNMGQRGHITRDEYTSCDKGAKKLEFAKVFDRNTELLKDNVVIPMPPVAFLNGDNIVMLGENGDTNLMLTLKESLEPEYALSRD